MAKNIPEIDDLIKGINDPEITLTDKRQEESDVHETGKAETTAGHTTAPVSLSGGLESAGGFLSFLEDTAPTTTRKSGWYASSTVTLPTRWTTATSVAAAVPTW